MAPPLDLTNPATLHAVARRAGLAPQGRLSQNFLIDRDVLHAIVAALGSERGDTVLEIGPGVGTLTGELAEQCSRVVAVDIDEACIRAAGITQRHHPNVELILADALRVDLGTLGLPAGWLAAGNLPYHITTPLLSRLFESDVPPVRGVFLVQREVAARLAADGGEWSLATVVIRSVAQVERLADVPPEAFDPPPRVHSSIIRLTPSRLMSAAERQECLELARGTFQMRRKMLRHALRHGVGGDGDLADRALAAATIDAMRRPGTLDLAEWRRLSGAVRRLRQS